MIFMQHCFEALYYLMGRAYIGYFFIFPAAMTLVYLIGYIYKSSSRKG